MFGADTTFIRSGALRPLSRLRGRVGVGVSQHRRSRWTKTKNAKPGKCPPDCAPTHARSGGTPPTAETNPSGRSYASHRRSTAPASGVRSRSKTTSPISSVTPPELVIETRWRAAFFGSSGTGRRPAIDVIEAKGFQVLRFSNYDFMTNREGVLETIATAIAARAPTLTLPRRRGRGRQDERAGRSSHEIHPLLAEGTSRHRRAGRKARRQAHHDRARGRAHRGQGEGSWRRSPSRG